MGIDVGDSGESGTIVDAESGASVDGESADIADAGTTQDRADVVDLDSGAAVDSDGAGSVDAADEVRADGPFDANDGNAMPDTTGPPPDPSLVGYWSFDEGIGTTATDSSGHGNTGLLQAGATWGPGKVGSHCLELKTTGQFVDIANPVVDTSVPYSVSAWISFSMLGGSQTVASIEGNTISAFYFQQRGTSMFSMSARDSDSLSANNFVALANGTTVVGTWYYFTGVFDGATLFIYVNGTLNGTKAFTSPWRALGHTFIGRTKFNGYTDYTTASIDEVRFYRRALSASEVRALFLLH
jgi:hypothetical protein